LVIDSLVRLRLDTAANKARARGEGRALQNDFGNERVVSCTGGEPFAVLQNEMWNPSTPTQKANNVEQLLTARPDMDSCCVFFFTDKGADHNPTHFEVLMRHAELFLRRKLCYLCHATHCGGLSAYNTAAERLNAAETRAIVNVPIRGSAHGPAMAADGSFNPAVAYLNQQWELDELEIRLQHANFCDSEVTVMQAESMTGCRCNVEDGCIANCPCERAGCT